MAIGSEHFSQLGRISRVIVLWLVFSQTKTPPKLLRGGVFTTVWLPIAIGLSIYVRFSQSVTYIGLLATVSGQRRPDVSAKPLGSKCSTRSSECSPLMHLVYPTLAYVPVPHSPIVGGNLCITENSFLYHSADVHLVVKRLANKHRLPSRYSISAAYAFA